MNWMLLLLFLGNSVLARVRETKQNKTKRIIKRTIKVKTNEIWQKYKWMVVIYNVRNIQVDFLK